MPPPAADHVTRPGLRKLIDAVLPTDADFHAFCGDYFGEVERRFSLGMDRKAKVNLLLSLIGLPMILARLRQEYPDKVRQSAFLFTDSHARQTIYAQEIETEIEQLLLRKEAFLSIGQETTGVEAKLLELRRKQRQGPQLSEGEVLAGRFKLLEIVGRGGFARVWQAYDRKTKQIVAVKVLHGEWIGEPSRRERFERGARKMSELQHTHIVKVILEPTEEDGFYFFVMEYLPGGNLYDAVVRKSLSQVEALRLALEAGYALHHAHEKGLIHRDVKPQNILIDGQQHAKLADFDLVHAENTTGGTRTGAMGTFIYAAPEELEDAKRVDRRADVYSLGMTFLFVLYGRNLPRRILQDATGFVNQLPITSELKSVLKKAVGWEASDRQQTVEVLCQQFSVAYGSDISISSSKAVSTRNVRKYFSRRFVLSVAFGVLLVAGAISSTLLKSSQSMSSTMNKADMALPLVAITPDNPGAPIAPGVIIAAVPDKVSERRDTPVDAKSKPIHSSAELNSQKQSKARKNIPNETITATSQKARTWEVVALNDNSKLDVLEHSAHAAQNFEQTFHDAQGAFMHGDRAQAIRLALLAAEKTTISDEKVKAWRFIGAASCSGRNATMANSSYSKLSDPEHRRLLVELCQRNGVIFIDGKFVFGHD